MNLAQALKHVTGIFKQNNIEEPANEAGVLLCQLLQIDKSRLFAQPETELTAIQLAHLDKLVQRRLSGEPAAYIIRKKEFYGIDLYVDSRVLIPRPETEMLVEEAIKFAQKCFEKKRNSQSKLLIADIGTGSGAIAIALASHISKSIIYGIDVSRRALEVAAINVKRFELENRITMIEGNLLEPINQKMDIIVANLPYIAEAELGYLQVEITKHEPRIALDGGLQGTDLFEVLMKQAKQKLVPGGSLLMEIGKGQEDEVTRLAKQAFPAAEISLTRDLQGINRVISINV